MGHGTTMACVYRESHIAVECHRQQAHTFSSREELQFDICVGLCDCRDRETCAVIEGCDSSDGALVGSVKSDRHSKDAPEYPDTVLIAIRQGRELGVFEARIALAVVAGHLGDQFDLVLGETGEMFAVTDQIVGVLVMCGVSHEAAHIVKEPSGFEDVALELVHLMDRRALIKELKGKIGGVLGMFDVFLEASGCAEHTGASQITQVMKCISRRFALLHTIEHHAFAQGARRHDELKDVERLAQLSEQDRACHDHIDTVGVETAYVDAIIGFEP